jgi:hypothetical protein
MWNRSVSLTAEQLVVTCTLGVKYINIWQIHQKHDLHGCMYTLAVFLFSVAGLCKPSIGKKNMSEAKSIHKKPERTKKKKKKKKT